MTANLDHKTSFGKVSQTYDEVRPTYPKQVIEKIIQYSGIPKNGKILEVGCGSAQATIAFAKKDFDITALDISESLIALAKRKTAGFPKVKYLLSSFEEAKLPENYFDLLISATAFHWVMPREGHLKAARVLKPGASLALFWNYLNPTKDDYIPGINEFFSRHTPGYPYYSQITKAWVEDRKRIEETKEFGKVTETQTPVRMLEFSKENYVKLVSTFGWVGALSKKEKAILLGELENLVENEKEPLKVPYNTFLLMARKLEK